MSMSALLSQRYWSREDAPARVALLAALAKLEPGQRLRLADVVKTRQEGDTDAAQRAADAGEDEAPPLCEFAHACIRAGSVDAETREVEFPLSSETPYERWWGVEILGHKSAECDLGWLASGRAPYLKDHNVREQIGVIARAWLRNKQVRVVVRYGHSAMAEQEMRDANAGVRVNVSVGYDIRELELIKKEGDKAFYRVTDWRPMEGSQVAIPADESVGIGRMAEADPAEQQPAPQARAQSLPAHPRMEHTMTQATAETKPQTGDEAYKANVATIQRLAKAYEKHLKPTDVADAIANGADPQKFNELVMERLASGATDTTTLAGIGATPKEGKRYSFMRALQSQVPGLNVDAGFEREASQAIAKAMGRDAEGVFIPTDVMFEGLYGRKAGEKRDFLAGTASQAGNLIQTAVDASMWTDVLRPALVLAQLGINVLPGLRDNLAVPRKTVAGTLAMLTEVAAASETQPTTALPILSPKRIGSYVEPSKQAIIQGVLGIENMLRQDLLDGGAVLAEWQGINGDATGANARGIRNVSGIGSVVGGANGANWAWSHVVGLETAVANANANSGSRAGYLTNTKVRGTSKTTQKAANLPFMWDNGEFPLNGYRAGITNNVPSNLVKGASGAVCSSAVFSSDWSMFVMGIFGGLDVTVDPYTLATTGQIRITLNMFIDWLCRQPGAFATMDDALTP